MVYEDQQKYAQSSTDGTEGGEGNSRRLLSSQKPSKVYSTAITGVPDSKGNPWSRLPRHSHNAQRVVGPATGTGTATCPTFYHALCSKQPLAAKTNYTSFTSDHLTTMQGRWITESSFKISCNRFDRHGDTVCFSILHSAVQTPPRTLQTSISEALGHLRYIHALDSWDGYRPRSQAGSHRSQSHRFERPAAAKFRDACGRCGLRVRAVSLLLSEEVWDLQHHPNYTARPAPARWEIESSDRTLSSTNEKTFPEKALRSALADRNGVQYVQTQHGFCRQSAPILQSSSGDQSARPRSRPDDSQASNLSSIQSMTVPRFLDYSHDDCAARRLLFITNNSVALHMLMRQPRNLFR